MLAVNRNLGNGLKRGRQIAAAEHSEKDKLKAGTLRAGTTGLIMSDGKAFTCCPRAAHLRFLGLEVKDFSDADLIMFQLGVASEESIAADLTLGALNPGEKILREEEIPIKWSTRTGVDVTGRPDIVICTTDPVTGVDIPQLVVEAKSVASFWVLKNLLNENKPKLSNVLQAAHYGWQLGVPAKLLYKQYAIHVTPDWCESHFPREGEPGSEHIEYTSKKVKTRNGEVTARVVKSIRQFEKVFDVRVTAEGGIEWKEENSEEWIDTTANISDIKRFYEFVSSMETSNNIGTLAYVMNADGSMASWNMCTYCPPELYCQVATKGKWDYKKWISEVRRTLDGKQKGT